MRQRFTEINITGNATSLPIGAEASNITLSDGSILEEALGKIDYQKNGSLVDQITAIQETNIGDFAPLQAPHFKEGIILRRYMNNNINFLTQIQPSNVDASAITGITAKYNNGIWTFNGTITSATDSRICILYGGGTDYYNYQIAGEGEYSVSVIDNGTLVNSNISVQFLWHNSASGEDRDFFIQGTNLSGTFSVPENCYLCRISLFIRAGASGTTLTNTTLQINLTKTGETPVEDKYNSVFDVQKNLSTNSWKTTVAENFTVDRGMQGEAKSILGTIYNTTWAGKMEMKEDSTGQLGIRLPSGGISFPVGALANYGTGGDSLSTCRAKLLNKTKDVRADGLYIAPHYDIESSSTPLANLFYAAPSHRFWITGDNGGQRLYIKNDETIVSNTLVANKVRSSMLPSYIYIDTRKELEDIINDDTNFPNYKLILFNTSVAMGNFLASGVSQASTSGIHVYGFGYKYKDSTNRRFIGIFAYSNLWRFSYTWTNNGKRQLQSYALTTGGSTDPRVNKTNLNIPNSAGW